MLSNLQRTESEIIAKATQVYLRDVHDHGVAVLEILETYREISAGIRDIYFSRMGVRTNEIMKALTLITTIFMPLTFLVGVYGMNFPDMPGLHHPNGFWIVMIIMVASTLTMLYWFRMKKWI
jgi:magnesium transporter